MTTCRLPSLAALCCTLLLLAVVLDSVQSVSCCLSYSKRRLLCARQKSFTIQTILGSCDIPAIIFHNRRGNVCANPFSNLTIELQKCVLKKMKIVV